MTRRFLKSTWKLACASSTWMVSRHWLPGGFHIHCGLNYFLATELCSSGHNSFSIMYLAATAEDCQQCCNNQEYYSEAIANGIKPAQSRPPCRSAAPRWRAELLLGLRDTGDSAALPGDQPLTSQCWTQRERQRTPRQERSLLSSLGSWLESALLVWYCALFSPGRGIFYSRTGPG